MSIAPNRPQNGKDGKKEVITHLLDFVKLPHLHSGKNMAKTLAEVLTEWGIVGKVSIDYSCLQKEFDVPEKMICITCDNASANTVMIEELAKLLPNYLGLKAHV